MSKIEKILHYFPLSELPVVVSEDYLQIFEGNADPFPQSFIEEIMTVWEKNTDEFTEFIPCFRLPGAEKFDAVVYWKGSLLKYEFILVTLDKNGEMINKKAIASTLIQDNIIKKSVASIDLDYIITIIAGQTYDGQDYDGSLSKSFSMEILPSGEIIFAFDELN